MLTALSPSKGRVEGPLSGFRVDPAALLPFNPQSEIRNPKLF